MSSELEVLKQRISELEAENVKIKADYETEIAVLKDENTKLRHIIEENARRDVRVEKLENRVAVMEQGSLVVGDQQQNDREVTPEVSAVDLPTTLQKSQLDSTDTKTSEEKEMDAFLDDAHKKKVSDEIRQHNREKKLLHESANQEISPNISSVKTVTDHDDRCSSENSGKNGNSVTNRDDRQKIIPVTADDDDDDDDVTELSKNQNIEQELTKELLSGSITIPSLSSETTKHPSSSLGTTQSLVHLFQNAIRAGHEEILSWLYYSNSFENKVDEIRCDTGVSDKMVRSRLYKEMLEHLPGITSGNLRMKTLRAKKIRMLFGEGGLGIDKVKKVTLSVYAISSLTISQIQSIIKNVTSVELSPDCNHVTSVTNRDDQTNTTEARSHDRSYFRNKTLDQYPTLYREYSSEDFDYYGITDKTLCPLCKLGHDDEESIEDNMTKSDKVLTPEYLDWHAKLSGLPSVLTDKIRFKLYNTYKKETGNKPWQLSEEAITNIPEKPQASDFKPITFEAKPDSELIIKSVLEHFPCLKFQNSFRGFDNYNFASPQPWSSPCPICNGKHGNYGLHGSWYCKNGNQHPYDPELAKLHFQGKLEYCLACNTSSNKLKFAIVA
ncbi:hypothetical protein RclHR1_16350004 [Rhizophagus clarus]|uniref:Uncharacterized protein n=1 Tax=Rhizophagus clarus TaxID=94130 RepID=A0A2Z6QWL6_9GLOM|nr:hypothetical protein RclHR1_16350004 [Rhizophagus clarus]